MILGDPPQATNVIGHRATLDDLFRRAAVRAPDRLALVDPPNRAAFTGTQPRSLTYAQADRFVWALAGRFRAMRLAADAVVATQLANTVEGALTLLAIIRAGLIAAPLPQLWRKIEVAAALRAVNAKAIVTCTQVGETRFADIAMQVASEVFSIRYIAGFGADLPDGAVPLDELFNVEAPDCQPSGPRSGNPAAHVAAVTFDIAPAGIVPVARNHIELIAGGLAVFLEGGLPREGTLLSATPVTSFAGFATTLIPWLLAGGTLALHQPFDAETFAAQRREHACDALVLPGPLAARLSESGELVDERLKSLIALWRAPERMSEPFCPPEGVTLVDVAAFGESGVVAGAHDADGKLATIPLGEIGAPRKSANAMPLLETSLTPAGTLALRGAMVPLGAFPPGAERGGMPCFAPDERGFTDTRFRCRPENDGQTLAVIGAPAGAITIGGAMLNRATVEAAGQLLPSPGAIAGLPDSLLGQRLKGSVSDARALAALQEKGVHALIAAAFRPRTAAPARADVVDGALTAPL